MRRAEGGLIGMTAPTFHGWVIGASHPAGVAADWLTSAWGQTGGFAPPAAAAAEEVAASWLLDLLGLPARGGRRLHAPARPWRTSPRWRRRATSSCAGPAGTSRRAGLFGAPEVNVVLGGEAHSTVFLTLRLLGFGAERVHVAAADDQGRMRPEALAAALAPLDGPTVVCLQAGNVVQRRLRPVRRVGPAGAGEGRLGACRWRLRALGAAPRRRWRR